jgi:tellurite resistance protein
VIIWGTKTKREGRGFLHKVCPICRSDQVHFVAETRSKFTLYFIPTFTYSTKALLICTRCEREETVEGAQAQAYLRAALPRHMMMDELRDRQSGDAREKSEPIEAGQVQSAAHRLAVGMVVLAVQVSLTDGAMDDAEAAAIRQGFATIHSSTKSGPVQQAAGLVVADFGEIMAWISSPATGSLEMMLADVGRVLRNSETEDQSRFIGQVAWLCDTIAAASGGASEAEMERMDSGLAIMGFSPQEVAGALAFCDRNGG